MNFDDDKEFDVFSEIAQWQGSVAEHDEAVRLRKNGEFDKAEVILRSLTSVPTIAHGYYRELFIVLRHKAKEEFTRKNYNEVINIAIDIIRLNAECLKELSRYWSNVHKIQRTTDYFSSCSHLKVTEINLMLKAAKILNDTENKKLAEETLLEIKRLKELTITDKKTTKADKSRANPSNSSTRNVTRKQRNTGSLENQAIAKLAMSLVTSNGEISSTSIKHLDIDKKIKRKLLLGLKGFGNYYALGSWDNAKDAFVFNYHNPNSESLIQSDARTITSILELVDMCEQLKISPEEYLNPDKRQAAYNRNANKARILSAIPYVIVFVIMFVIFQYI